jgi:hypothetical protein
MNITASDDDTAPTAVARGLAAVSSFDYLPPGSRRRRHRRNRSHCAADRHNVGLRTDAR